MAVEYCTRTVDNLEDVNVGVDRMCRVFGNLMLPIGMVILRWKSEDSHGVALPNDIHERSKKDQLRILLYNLLCEVEVDNILTKGDVSNCLTFKALIVGDEGFLKHYNAIVAFMVESINVALTDQKRDELNQVFSADDITLDDEI